MEKTGGGSRLLQMQMYYLNNSESGKMSRSLDHVNWWSNEARNRKYQFRSGSSMSEDREIRNGWLTLPEDFKARFQQRQMIEKEQKMVAVYEAQQARALTRVSGTLGTSASAPASDMDIQQRQGKVRQMFEERRTKAGIDKSYPLQPIQNNSDRNQAKKPLTNGHGKVTLSKTKAPERSPVKPTINNNSHSIRKQKSDLANGNSDFNHNTHSKHTSNNNSWSHATRARSTDRLDGLEQNQRFGNLEDETFPEELAPSPSPRTLPTPPPRVKAPPPVTEKRSPAVSKPTARAQPRAAASVPRVNNTTSRSSSNENTVQPTRASPSGTSGGNVKSAHQPASPAAAKGRTNVGTRVAASSGGAAAGEPCSICGRRFAADRIEKHEEICKKSQTKKRKPYDALKHRLEGTEAAGFIKQIRKLPPPGRAPSTKTKPTNSSWRQKHEDFIKAIRAAKQVQAHIASGGKLSDLPPPPPSENPDYVQCPHCNRRFNQGAAERHIPKCKDFQFNKPKRR